jgi:hypothetical protein
MNRFVELGTIDFKFTGRLIPAKITGAGDIPVSVADIEDVVEGNIYDHEGAD